MKCVLEKKPFFCHMPYPDGKEHLCAGWKAMIDKDAPTVIAPWDFVGGFDDADVSPDDR